MTDLQIPVDLLPADGHFGSGPAKVRRDALLELSSQTTVMGSSHRQEPVKKIVSEIKHLLSTLYSLPEGYEIGIGNGGSTLMWDALVCSFIAERSIHGVCGEFSRKFATAASKAPFLQEPIIVESPPGSISVPGLTATAQPGQTAEGTAPMTDGSTDPAPSVTEIGPVDTAAWVHNETSTGVICPIHRPTDPSLANALVAIDATSAAGGIAADISQTDVYYFAPQKNFSSDGGLWVAFFSPAAIERIKTVCHSGRWIPDMLNLDIALANSRKDQTLNTPALATLMLLANQLRWINDHGGMEFITSRTLASTNLIYDWAQRSDYASCFVKNPQWRSPVVATIDLDERIDANTLISVLRANGILDVNPYRSLGRNQLRIGAYVSVDPADVAQLLRCIDWVAERISLT